jgi:hypothetical protein
VAAPWVATPGIEHIRASIWQIFRGPTAAREPASADLSRRYAELLLENLGQPGFRELIVAVLDLETRADLIFAALGEERRQPFFHRRGAEAGHQGHLVDLAGVGRGHVLDALAGALSIPVLTEPHLIAFSPESYWKGETHRTCDRPAAVGRLLQELAAAGVEQVIVVSADADRSVPHQLKRPGRTLKTRIAEHLAAAEAAAVRDGIATQGRRFKGIFLIRPAHNPTGPFDFRRTYDERSDRYQDLEELVSRGYEDAYRQFIEPAVAGAD